MMLLGNRQRAMLREMGVRVWQPAPAMETAAPAGLVSVVDPVRPSTAIDSGAARARIDSPAASFNTPKPHINPEPAAAPTDDTASSQGHPAWRVGALQTLYADTAVQNARRWLILLEAPASALQGRFNPLDGDAGKLLDNMLRAARLPTAGAVLLAPVVRGDASTSGDLPSALAHLSASAKADVVLVMGRLAAQALLQSTEPLAKLRGRIHSALGTKTVITIDPAYLLRNPLDKAKAWDDLCLGLSLV